MRFAPFATSPALEPLAQEVCELSAHTQAALAELARLAAAFDESRGWAGAGIRSCVHWLTINTGLDLHTAAELLRVGQALRSLPKLAAAFGGGGISFDKVRAVTRIATPADEQTWLEIAREASGSQLVRIVREVSLALASDSAQSQPARRSLCSWWQEDGMLRLAARLAPEEGAVVLAALEAAAASGTSPEPDDPALDPVAARRADALVAICEHSLATPADELKAASVGQVVVHVDVGVLTGEDAGGRCHLDRGPGLSAEVARRLGCEAEVVAILEREGLPIDVGRKRRLPSARQRRALNARDRGCRFPGCGVPPHRTHAHHLKHWALGGPTVIGNLVSLCHFHHRRLHDHDFRIQKDERGSLRFESADGRLIGPVRQRRVRRGGGAARLRRAARERGQNIDADTPVAQSCGAAVDLAWAVDVLCDNRIGSGARAGPQVEPLTCGDADDPELGVQRLARWPDLRDSKGWSALVG